METANQPPLRVAVVDTETTGLSPKSDRILEIAILLLEVEPEEGRILRELERYEGLQDPGVPIPYGAFAVHGISDEMVKGQRINEATVARLLKTADLVVAHNSGFDKGFVAQVLPEVEALPWACSCRGVPWKACFDVHSSGLQALAHALELPRGRAHRAMGDVETTAALLAVELPLRNHTALGHLIRQRRPGESARDGRRSRR